MVRRCSLQAADLHAHQRAWPADGDASLVVTFTNLSSPAEEIEGYQWSFGDGSTLLTTGGATSTLTDPVHVYDQIGEFTVILTLRAEPTRLSLRREPSVERSSQAQDEAATAGSQSDVESKAGYISVSGLPALVTRTITYTYDRLYRLTEADYSSGERFEYAYDAVGNPVSLHSRDELPHCLHRHGGGHPGHDVHLIPPRGA
jgi:YD repeat-containing protein